MGYTKKLAAEESTSDSSVSEGLMGSFSTLPRTEISRICSEDLKIPEAELDLGNDLDGDMGAETLLVVDYERERTDESQSGRLFASFHDGECSMSPSLSRPIKM
jgi:hypothetical protein